jgi:DNA polymerase-1
VAAPRIVVIDGTNSLYRAFFAIPGLRAPDGTPTNAALGFTNMLGKVVREERPDHVIVVFDARGKTFRHELYDAYKAGRDAQPEDLSAQVPLVREIVAAHHIPILEIVGFEADDVIATLVAQAPSAAEMFIVSTDKDLMQLVSERVTLLDGIKDRRYGPAEVEKRFGVAPDKVLDLRALVGDPSDNIPGVKGIGEKGAAKLIGEYGDLETLIERRQEIKAKHARESLDAGIDDARLSKHLATLRSDLELPFTLDDARLGDPDVETLREIYERLGFTRLIDALGAGAEGAPASSASTEVSWRIASTPDEIQAAVKEIEALSHWGLDVLAGDGVAAARTPTGIALALDAERAIYVPLTGLDDPPSRERLEALLPLLTAPGDPRWIARNAKRAQLVFGEFGFAIGAPHFDIELAGGLIDSAAARGIDQIAARELGLKVRSLEDFAGRGAKAKPLTELPQDDVAHFAAEEACAVMALFPVLARRLDDQNLSHVADDLELPLTGVLARMEQAGVRVDESVLERLSVEYQVDLDRIEGAIYESAGEKFLVSSPKQLQRILFEKLNLTPIKKTKTGYSTDEGVLEQLAIQHELPAQILSNRRLSKLKNTYVDALPPLVDERTGRIHPTFNQLGAATGRLSATNPNVQNIPIRTPEGVRIREAFVPAEGCLLLSADYSQVELRILAHFSGDESLLDAFRNDEDIHRQTAAEVNGIELSQVDDDQRARAKAVNFGIIYGLGSFGLANQLGIASADAKQMIEAYFERYRGVRRFLDETIEVARERGFVTTLEGRRRHLPDLGSRNRVLRQAAERMAVNSVIQGTAADLIKQAMLDVDTALSEAGLAARMILQVHDELVFDVPEAEVEALTLLVRDRMEGVSRLEVPLRVEVGVGKNWREAH